MKKVSYITLLKEAIQEYDAKAMDKLGPMTEPILTFKGDGELKTHYDANNLTSSVLERYYFNETKEKLVEMDEDPDAKSEASDKSGSGPEGDAVDPNEIVTGEEADGVEATMKDLEDEILDEDFELGLDEDPNADELIANEEPFDEDGEQDICQADEKPLDEADADVMQNEDLEDVGEGLTGAAVGSVLGAAGGKYLGGTEVGKKIGDIAGTAGGAVVGGGLGHLLQQRTKQATYRPESISLEDTVINKLIQEMEAEDPDGSSEASKKMGDEADAVDPNNIVTGEEAESTKTTMGQLEDEILDEEFDLDEGLVEEDLSVDEGLDIEEDLSVDEGLDIEEDFNLDEEAAIEEDLSLDEDFDLSEGDDADADDKTGEGEDKPLDVDAGGEPEKTSADVKKESFEGRGPIIVSKARELGEAFKIFKDEIDE
jgi:hypothetical protein